MANTPKPINWEEVKFFIKAGTTQKDIAQSLGLEPDTLRSRVKQELGIEWSVFSAQQYSEGNKLILGKQFKKAIEGNVPMLLHLGKVRIGQREPEPVSAAAPHQQSIDQQHLIMELQNKIAELEAKIADQPKTE